MTKSYKSNLFNFIKFFRLKKKNNKTQDQHDFYLSSFFSSSKYLHGSTKINTNLVKLELDFD